MSEKENKTSASRIKSSMDYDKRHDLKTIACKVTRTYQAQIEAHAKSKGYKSINAYLLALIDNDMNNNTL